MSASRFNSRGFTLLEVTLAIVIGIIVFAGATLIYNQAKASASETRAKAKVMSLQSLVEQSMAKDGIPPEVDALRALWVRQRPDDWNKSAWGGAIAPVQFPGTTDTSGIVDGADLTPDSTEMSPTGTRAIGGVGGVRGPPSADWSGILLYYRFSSATEYLVFDETRQAMVKAKNYAIATVNVKGERWFHVATNPAMGSSKVEVGEISGWTQDTD